MVSIITPTYNHEKYIEECIISVLNQSYKNWEMIIIDDASTDNTVKIVEKYEKEDSRIKLIVHENNYGPFKLKDTYNEGFEKAKGKYIAILEGDDIMPKNKLKIQVELLENINTDYILSYGNCLVINEKKKPIAYYKPSNIDRRILFNDPMGYALYYFSKLETFINPQTVLIRKDSLKKIGGFKGSEYLHLVDYPTWLHLSLIGKFFYINKTLGIWRRHFSSITLQYGKEFLTLERLSKYFLEFIKKKKNELESLNITFNEGQLFQLHRDIISNRKKIQDYFIATFLLSLKKNKEAKKLFFKILKQKNISIEYKIASIVGIISCYLKKDILGLYRLFKNKFK